MYYNNYDYCKWGGSGKNDSKAIPISPQLNGCTAIQFLTNKSGKPEVV